jgi:hypothetical protein
MDGKLGAQIAGGLLVVAGAGAAVDDDCNTIQIRLP